MKAFIAKLAIVLMFATGSVFAGDLDSDGSYSGCQQQKWEDT